MGVLETGTVCLEWMTSGWKSNAGKKIVSVSQASLEHQKLKRNQEVVKWGVILGGGSGNWNC